MDKMRCLTTSMLVMLMSEVSLEETTRVVEAVEGGSVILPCSSSGVPKSEELNVFWRYNNKKKVLNISSGKVSGGQDPVYVNRTESFGNDEHTKGNFSIKLSNVRKSDEGEYSCFMHFSDTTQKVQVRVNAAQPTSVPTLKPTTPRTTKSKNKSVESRSVESLLIFCVLLGYRVVLL